MPKSSKKSNNNTGSFSFNGKYLVVTVAFALVSSAILGPVFAAKGGGNAKSPAPDNGSTVTTNGIYIVAPYNRLNNGQQIAFELRANSNATYNAVQANLAYPADKLEFVSVDGTTSDFSISAQETASNGLLTIVRAANPAVSGDKKIATITFKAISGGGSASITTTDSLLLDISDNSNVATDNRGVSFRLSK